jgi:hypothetical protein
MQRTIRIHARLVDRNHRPIVLPECDLAVGEIRVDPRTDDDVELVDVDKGMATFLPLRGTDRMLFEVSCAEAMNWQYLGTIQDRQLVA